MADIRVDASGTTDGAPRRTALSLLDDIRIASPCPARWEDMAGDDRSRHCGECDRRVYDLSAMTAEQALTLIRENEGGLCVRLYRRWDGRVLTADCPEGLRDKLMLAGRRGRGWVWVSLALVCGLFTYAFFLGADRGLFPFGRSMGAICPPRGAADVEELPPPLIEDVVEPMGDAEPPARVPPADRNNQPDEK
jgi:hypothetical protein